MKLQFFQRSNIFFSKDRSASQKLSFLPITTRQHKKTKNKINKNKKQTKHILNLVFSWQRHLKWD